MFTGLIEVQGKLTAFDRTPSGRMLAIDAGAIAGELALGESISVNGVCLTAASIDCSTVNFDLLEETLQRTNLGNLAVGSGVNLERALAANGRLGGHFVQGHVDTTAPVLAAQEIGADLLLDIALAPESSQYVVQKGSIAVNGVSLTVAQLNHDHFRVCIIPHTKEMTNLGSLKPNDRVNLEFDILAKYIEQMVGRTING